MDKFFPWIVGSTSVKKELCRSRAGKGGRNNIRTVIGNLINTKNEEDMIVGLYLNRTIRGRACKK